MICILIKTVKPKTDKNYAAHWCLQQNSLPVHTANSVQKWRKNNTPTFISKDMVKITKT